MQTGLGLGGVKKRSEFCLSEMTEAKELRDYVDAMTLPPGSGLTRAKLELAKVSGGLTDELNLDQLNLTDEDMKVLIGPISKLGKNLRVLKLFLNELSQSHPSHRPSQEPTMSSSVHKCTHFSLSRPHFLNPKVIGFCPFYLNIFVTNRS